MIRMGGGGDTWGARRPIGGTLIRPKKRKGSAPLERRGVHRETLPTNKVTMTGEARGDDAAREMRVDEVLWVRHAVGRGDCRADRGAREGTWREGVVRTPHCLREKRTKLKIRDYSRLRRQDTAEGSGTCERKCLIREKIEGSS